MPATDSHSNPYASPSEMNSVAIPGGIQVHLDFWRVFLVVVGLTIAVVTPMLWVASWWNLLRWYSLVPAASLAFLLQAIIIRLQRVTASDQLLRCGDFWSRPRTISLISVKRVTHHGLPPFRFVRVYSDELKRPLLLPLFLEQPQTFWRHLVQVTAPGNPLHSLAANQLAVSEPRHSDSRPSQESE